MSNLSGSSLGALLVRLAREYWWVYLSALLGIFFTHLLQVELPFIAKQLGELVLADKTEDIPYFRYLLIALGIIMFRTSSRVLFFWPARVLQGRLMEEITVRLEQCPPWRYQSYSTGQLYQHLVNDIVSVRAFIGFGLLHVGNTLIAIAVLAPRLAEFNEHLLIAFFPLVVGGLTLFLMTFYTQKFYREMSHIQGEVQNLIVETYKGKRTIKNFQAEKAFFKLFEWECRRELHAFFKGAMGGVVALPLMKLGVGLSFLWGAYIIYVEQLGATTLILFSGFVFLLQGPMMFASWVGIVTGRALASWRRIKSLLKDLEVTSQEEISIEELNRKKKHFNLNMWGQEVSFPFHINRWNVIVGDTGSGKSILLKYYATLLKSQGRGISYVAQENHLYNDTIQNNLFLGKDPSPIEIDRARELLELFHLGVLAADSSALMDMVVGENGKRVSGGQAKRICLVRSLVLGSDVLIWDDPFSNVDVILERKIVAALRNNPLYRKTVVLTSHRLSTVKLCDEVFYIKKGEGLIERGAIVDMIKEKTKIYAYFEQQKVV